MKILLINSTGGFGFQRQNKKRLPPINIPPLGLLYLARSLEDEGHKVEVLELFAEEGTVLMQIVKVT